MVTYIVRRLITAALILLGASFLVYLLTAASGDPLEEFRASSAPNKQQLMDARIELLQLDTPAPIRYFQWLGGAAGCLIPFADACDLGKNIAGQPITRRPRACPGPDPDPGHRRHRPGDPDRHHARHHHGPAPVQHAGLRRDLHGLPVLLPPDLLGRGPPEGVRRHRVQQLPQESRDTRYRRPSPSAPSSGVADGRDGRRRDETPAAHRRRRASCSPPPC